MALLMNGWAAVALSAAVFVTTVVVFEMLSTSTPAVLTAELRDSCRTRGRHKTKHMSKHIASPANQLLQHAPHELLKQNTANNGEVGK